MRYRHPKAEFHASGIWGGIGTRPSPEVWTPTVEEESPPEEAVPPRFRGLRIHRTISRRLLGSEGSGIPLPALLILAFLVIGPALIFLSMFFL